MKKIRVAFIFESSNIFLSRHHFDNTYYHFFINALKRNERLEMTYFPTKEIFDASILKDNFDIILLWQNTEFGMPKEILGIQELDIPVIADVCDPQDAKNALEFHKKWKIDHSYRYFRFCFVGMYTAIFFYLLKTLKIIRAISEPTK